MEELVWNNNSSMLPTVSTPSPWDYGTVISFQIPASCSAPVPSIPDLPCGNVDDSSILGIQQQPDISYSPLQSNAIANKHPHLQVKKIPGQMIPSLLDKIAADSVLTRSISVTGWGHASPTEIPASSFSAATNMPVFQSKSEINQNFLDHTIACLQQSGSSSCNDLMKFSYSYDDSQMRYLQSCIESLDCVLFAENSIEKDDGMSPTSTTQKNMTGNKKSKVLSASIPSNNIIEDYQFASQSTSNSITMKSKAMKSKSKTKTCKDDPQLGLQYNYSASTSSSSCLIFDNVNPAGIEPDAEAIASMKEMVYRAAVFRPVNLGTEVLEKPKRKNVRISSHPQTVAARQRRERINDRLRVLQRLVPGGTKMDTASMLEEAVNYLKFLKTQVKVLQSMANNKVDNNMQINSMAGFCSAGSSLNSFTSLSSALNSHIYQNRLL